MRNIKIAYIGGGSKNWARVFMNDLALSDGLSGEIALYDIDLPSAYRNQKIGQIINSKPKTRSKFNYEVYENIEDALKGSDFVIISILPGTFNEMYSDVHEPEKYGILQSVGDTVGPGGVLRAMRTVPIYEEFAKKIEKCCPSAWVINLTNPMSICTKTLYDVFPNIKAFGCCHEVFHAQDFLCLVASDILGIARPNRKEIYTDASGINHFTWIKEAYYKEHDLLALIPEFAKKYYEEGYYEGEDRFAFKTNTFAYGNKVKMDLFLKYGELAAAGDRHLVEFVNNKWYLGSKKEVLDWKFQLTTVDQRIEKQKEQIEESIAYANGSKEFELVNSNEEVVDIMKALMGEKILVTNVNYPNIGQVKYLPESSIVETNCVFSSNSIMPIISKDLNPKTVELVARNCIHIDLLYDGIKARDLETIYSAFAMHPLVENLSKDDCKKLFKSMVRNTRSYLDNYYELDKFLED